MDGIVPRWEWRTFDEPFGDAVNRLVSLETARPAPTEELYLLSGAYDASVKVRDELMDVKRLVRVDGDGLEQWRPAMKAPFPLSRDDIVAVMHALGVASVDLKRGEYTLDELLAEVVAPNAGLVTIRVRKRRARFTVGGCMAELSELRTDRGASRTAAVESTDPELVRATVRELGLASRENVSVPRHLAATAVVHARRYAVIDIGTNSVKFHIGERAADGTWRTIADRAEVTRLGEGLNATGRLGEEPIRRTVQAIAGMAHDARGVQAIAAVGTAGMRLAANRDALIDAVRAATGIAVEVISGEEEARLAYLGAISQLDPGEGALTVFDTGGGSSQFTIGNAGRVEDRFSVNLGAARLTERYGLDGPVDDAALAAASTAIAAELAALDGRPTPATVVGLGGAVTNLAAVKHGLAAYDADVVQGSTLDRGEIERQIELYRSRDADERRKIVGLQPDRAPVILAGACIVRGILAKLGRDALTVSDRGLRHGVLIERFAGR